MADEYRRGSLEVHCRHAAVRRAPGATGPLAAIADVIDAFCAEEAHRDGVMPPPGFPWASLDTARTLS